MFELGLKIFISYLAGSINGALFIGQFFGGIDIRESGSGNAGGTNALRTQGKLFGSLVMLVDVVKGVLPVLLLPGLALGQLDPAVSREWLTYACGAAAIFGHCYPVWYDFRGGKGAATTLGVLAATAPVLLLPAGLAWFLTLVIFGYVGLATVLAGFAIPLFVLISEGREAGGLLVFTFLIGLFVAYTHRSNLRRLYRGEGSPDFRRCLVGRMRQAR